MAEERLSLLPLLFLSLIFRNMDSEELEAFQQELTCSICMNCFLDPVTIDCGHSFCRPCLSLCWEEDQTPRSCPECRGIAERPDFKTNIALKRLASLLDLLDWTLESPQQNCHKTRRTRMSPQERKIDWFSKVLATVGLGNEGSRRVPPNLKSKLPGLWLEGDF